MTIRIKAPRAWSCDECPGEAGPRSYHGDIPVRIVRESDWRKLMKLVRAVENYAVPDGKNKYYNLMDALDALKEKAK